MELKDIVLKLTGKITPVADASIDAERLENLTQYADLFYKMWLELEDIAREYKDSPYSSANKIGKHAEKILNLVKE